MTKLREGELERGLLELAQTMKEKFAQPEYIPGCEVTDVTNADEYGTGNGWIEAFCGAHNNQRVRYKGRPAGVQIGDFVDVEYFPNHKLFEVRGAGSSTASSINNVRVSELWVPDASSIVIETDADGLNFIPANKPVVPVAGDILVDSANSNILTWYDGTAWQVAGGSSLWTDKGGSKIYFDGDVGIGDFSAASIDGLVHIADSRPQPHFLADNFENPVEIRFRRAEGSLGSETDISANDTLAQITGWGYASGYRRATLLRLEAEAVGANHVEGRYEFWTRNASGTAERVRITADGNVGIGDTFPGYPLTIASSGFELMSMSRSTTGGAGFRLGNTLTSLNVGIAGGSAAPTFFAGAPGGADNFFAIDTDDLRVQSGMYIGWSSSATEPVSGAIDTHFSRISAGVISTPGSLTVGSIANSGRKFTTFGTNDDIFMLAGAGGRGGFAEATDVAATAQILVPDDPYDITQISRIMYAMVDSGGNTRAGEVTLAPGDSTTIVLSVGVSAFNLRCNANGSLDIRRTLGALTGNISIFSVWL